MPKEILGINSFTVQKCFPKMCLIMVSQSAIMEGFLETVSLESWRLTSMEGYIDKGVKDTEITGTPHFVGPGH